MDKTGFLEEGPSNKSATRLIFVFGSFWAMLLCSYLAYENKSNPAVVLAVFAGIETTLSGLKLIQKNMETASTPVVTKS